MDFRSDEFTAQRVQAEALGQPGQRRFRLLVAIGGTTTIVWMEKQQLQALGLALEQMLEQLPEAGPSLGGDSPPISFDLDTRRQFRVGRMELGYDDQHDRIIVVAHDIGDAAEEEDEAAAFVCALSREQARHLSAEATSVVAAGRPRCTMCGAPMGPGPHVCPQQNGHLPHQLDDTDEADEVG